jgi:hypothetical protein
LKLLRVLPLSSHSVWGNPCSRPPATHIHTVRPSPATPTCNCWRVRQSRVVLCITTIPTGWEGWRVSPRGLGGWRVSACFCLACVCLPPPLFYPSTSPLSFCLAIQKHPPPSPTHPLFSRRLREPLAFCLTR